MTDSLAKPACVCRIAYHDEDSVPHPRCPAHAKPDCPRCNPRAEGLKRFDDSVTDVQSRIIIVHQLRASADIQDRQTKRETGWADTSDRAQLMREAANVIERLATPSLKLARATCETAGLVVIERRTADDWRSWTRRMIGGKYADTVAMVAIRALNLILPDTAKGEGE